MWDMLAPTLLVRSVITAVLITLRAINTIRMVTQQLLAATAAMGGTLAH
jgi:hypothetical protein